MKISEEFILVIDTDSDTHSFYKQFGAYCTGLVSEEETDFQYSDLFYLELNIEDDVKKTAIEKNPFYGLIYDRQDETGSWSPYSVWPSRIFGMHDASQEEPVFNYSRLTENNYHLYDQPAPFSIGIFFDYKPETELVEIIKERAVRFFNEHCSLKNVGIEGFRLISHEKFAEEYAL